MGALYTTLDRLEAKGLVKTWMGEGTPQRGGRSKRMVRVTPAGAAAARNFYDTMIRMSNRAPWVARHRPRLARRNGRISTIDPSVDATS